MWRPLVVVALLLAGSGTGAAAPVVAGPPGGPVGRMLVAPSDGRVIYASAASGALFLTGDGGRHWRLIPQDPALALNLLAVDPTRPSVVYASDGQRLLRSTDSGRHWRFRHRKAGGVSGLVIDPRHPRTLYISAGSSLYRSGDAGVRWREIAPFLPPEPGVRRRHRVPGGLLAIDRRGRLILGSDDLYRSPDGGRHWTVLRRAAHVMAIALDPTRADTLYVTGGGLPSDGDTPFKAPGVFRSRDGGRTWVRTVSGYFDHLAIEPRSPSTLYGTTQSPAHLMRTIDGGRSWQVADQGLDVGSSLGPLALGAGRPARVYVGTGEGGGAPGGLHVSTNRGRRWGPTGPGLVSSGVIAAATAPRCPARLYAATGFPDFPGEASHLYVSGDGARRWSVPAVGPPATRSGPSGPALFFASLAVDAGTPTTAYAGASTGVWRTTDAGRHWARLESGPASLDLLFGDPRHPGTVYASTPSSSVLTLSIPRRLMVTRDGGATWAATGLAPPGQVALTAMAFDPRRPGVLYAAARAPSDDLPVAARVGDGVFGSTDGGATWALVSAGLGDLHVGALALDPRHPATMYAATESHGLYRSRDAGRSWRRMGRGPIPGERRVNVLAVDPATSRLYAANGPGAFGNGDIGVWRSADGGHTWSSVAPRILHAVVSGIAIDSTGTYLDAATYGSGVVRIPLRARSAPRCRG